MVKHQLIYYITSPGLLSTGLSTIIQSMAYVEH